jgi:hypothetical protein
LRYGLLVANVGARPDAGQLVEELLCVGVCHCVEKVEREIARRVGGGTNAALDVRAVSTAPSSFFSAPPDAGRPGG